MKLESVEIENYRAVAKLKLPLDRSLTVLHGDNAHGKTSVLSAIAVGLGAIPRLLPDVSGIGFLKTDRLCNTRRVRITLKTTDGLTWDRQGKGSGESRQSRQTTDRIRRLRERMDALIRADSEGSRVDLPIVAFYDTERAVAASLLKQTGFDKGIHRFAALEGALAARANFRALAEWFYSWENEELREQKQRRSFEYELKELQAVRKAITQMVPGVSGIRIKHRPRRIMLSFEPSSSRKETLSLNQLSGGHRIVFAVAGDLARRMAHGNPHLTDPLHSEAIVLIDEIELHLHPSWQQHILPDLMRVFPNTQFIVSTHSPQVLTSIRPEQIVKLRRDPKGGSIVAEQPMGPTYGAEAGDVLNVVMGVDERPPNDFAKNLKRYNRLINDDKGESDEAKKLRSKLESLSPRDFALDMADLEIRRRKLFAKIGASQ